MSDAGLDTVVAGVRCRDVLADLSAYVDGELSIARVQELQAHLTGCDRCTQFGGQVARLVNALRTSLPEPPSNAAVVSAVLQRIQRGG